MQDYRGYKYWLVETLSHRMRRWRIEFPNGHRTPPFDRPRETDVRDEIDALIAAANPP